MTERCMSFSPNTNCITRFDMRAKSVMTDHCLRCHKPDVPKGSVPAFFPDPPALQLHCRLPHAGGVWQGVLGRSKDGMGGEGAPKALKRRKITWDENNLTENERIKAGLSPVKIDEPKTPYHSPPREEDFDDMFEGGRTLESLHLMLQASVWTGCEGGRVDGVFRTVLRRRERPGACRSPKLFPALLARTDMHMLIAAGLNHLNGCALLVECPN